MKTNLLNLVSYGTLILAFFVLVVYLYYNVYPFKILEFRNVNSEGMGTYEVLDKEVKAGELLRYRSIFTKYLDYNGEVFCFYEDGILFRIPPFTADNFVGNTNSIRAVQIPITLPEGDYRYSCQIFYRLPMGREIVYQFKTDTFTVIK